MFYELLMIIFKSDLKELVMYFIEEYKKNSLKSTIPIEIFELYIENDESIYLDILSLNALIKKYFHLTRKLLKFKVCIEFLNKPPPNEYNLAWINKYHVYSKKK